MLNLKSIVIACVITAGVTLSGVSVASSNLNQNLLDSPVFLQNTGAVAMNDGQMHSVKGAGIFGDIISWTENAVIDTVSWVGTALANSALWIITQDYKDRSFWLLP
ncbi:hypothetical protein BTHERMOSOX_855 [Bathymodiolus thermophilus thioautotrophic gill symbiont]|uniref:Uncharacterized protein n=1 Tax=Bathymodiolus thermophilus thioautotrophic gill symbiont TaxID=2360 RepID=A0A1J5UJT0_9GAMM|nr:hypothetical protein [Bathymodiolus thermophilus thioautotrophic gill symbiont]AYQ55898.1 hypothetical protein MS2017_0139 [Bathymodiolus thermophilus thioautotrophic gill symbiont]OIR24519.1 hypothetical protein BGC33_10850 [Bathymodiolus thermophilus thioautotrophic gill symbiont]CAB5493904.1 hypothetical protein THERMOS_16 [Bathymodiolus thermophilus thioautotrophic gill symbiont]CAB5494504.1 hypothetical protein THERMOT_116 [Bathymodiolus thermophilus thioautotrophic gill symbiont]SHA02